MVDGFNIMCLISTLFWVLMPNFIKEGRLCWLRAPLYRLQKGSERVFAYNDEELKELRKTQELASRTKQGVRSSLAPIALSTYRCG